MNLSTRKKIHLQVIKGKYKGKKIPIPPSLHGHRNVTSSLIKEAIFQHIENFFSLRLDGERKISIPFFDLCAGSSQIAIEALSRGFSPVHIVERDKNRLEFVIENIKNIIPLEEEKIYFHNKNFIRLANDIATLEHAIAFIDLPYSFWKDNESLHLEMFFKSFKDSFFPYKERINNKFLFLIQSPVSYVPEKSFLSQWGFYHMDFVVKNYHYRKHYLNLFFLKKR